MAYESMCFCLPSPTLSICLSPQVSCMLFSKNLVISPLLKKPTLDKDQLTNYQITSQFLMSICLSYIENNRACCKMSTDWSHSLQWSPQSPPVCLLQASLHWNSPTVVLYIHDHLINADGSPKLSCLCLLNLSSAFDTINCAIPSFIVAWNSWLGFFSVKASTHRANQLETSCLPALATRVSN